jgi:uncharacterized protein
VATPTDRGTHPSKQGIHVLAKPIGPVCKIKCDYCFYLEKHALFGKHENYRTPDRNCSTKLRRLTA